MRTLHTAYRVTDLGVSLGFYAGLGYRVVGRIRFDDGATLTMLKFPDEPVVTLELVHRPADGAVQVGTGFSHLLGTRPASARPTSPKRVRSVRVIGRGP